MIRLMVFLCLICPPATAGPWLRAKGDQFLSVSVETIEQDGQINPYSAVYYEMGLSDRWTVGLDAGADILGYSSALAFARTSLWQGKRGDRMAVELALGAVQDASGPSIAIRPGISWGRGLELYQGGWIAVDATFGRRVGNHRNIAKIETTLGLNHGDRSKFLFQVTLEKPSGEDLFVSATPGLAYRVGKEFHLVAGIVASNSRSAALKFGIWREF